MIRHPGLSRCRDLLAIGSRLGFLGSVQATPGGLQEDIHVFMNYFQDQMAEVVKV
jgi:hypothetical protein